MKTQCEKPLYVEMRKTLFYLYSAQNYINGLFLILLYPSQQSQI